MHFPVFKIYQDSFKHVWHHKLPWFRVAFVPGIIYLLGFVARGLSYLAAGTVLGLEGTLSHLAHNTSDDPFVTAVISIGNVLNYIFSMIAAVSFLLKGFRYGVFGEGGQQWWSLHLNMRFVRVFLYYLLVGVLVILYMLIAGGITAGIYFGLHYLTENQGLAVMLTIPSGVILAAYGIILLFRINLTFLLIAIDEPKPLRTSWHMLKDNVWRLIGLLVLIALTMGAFILVGGLILALIGFLSYFVSSILVGIIIFLGVVFLLFAAFIYWAVNVKAASLVYLALKKGK